MRVLAIDPGPQNSGWILWDNRMVEGGQIANGLLRERLKLNDFAYAEMCVVEGIASYGMAVGKEVFETCIWIGRFMECTALPFQIVYRKQVKLHLCGSPKAKDANIRQALIDKHGAPGTKKEPGPTYGISGHIWSALALADYAVENLNTQNT